jgi:hypothetical protein
MLRGHVLLAPETPQITYPALGDAVWSVLPKLPTFCSRRSFVGSIFSKAVGTCHTREFGPSFMLGVTCLCIYAWKLP